MFGFVREAHKESIMGELNTIIVPYWLRDSLVGRDIPLGTLLDYDKAKSLLSFTEQVELLLLQDIMLSVFKANEVNAGSYVLHNQWILTCKDNKKQLDQVLKEVNGSQRDETVIQLIRRFATDVTSDRDSKIEVEASGKNGTLFVILNEEANSLTLPEYDDLTQVIIQGFFRFGNSQRVYLTEVFKTYIGMMADRVI